MYFDYQKTGKYLHFVLFKGDDQYSDILTESVLDKKEAKKMLETLQAAANDLEFFLKSLDTKKENN